MYFRFNIAIAYFVLIFKKLFIFGCAGLFSSRGELGLLLVAMCGLLVVVASLVAELWLQACRLQ